MVGEIDLARIQDPALRPVAEKVTAGQRLAPADGLALYATTDLLGLGMLADWANRQQERRSGLLLRQSAHQPHQRLHPPEHLHLLLLRADAEGGGRVYPLPRGGVRRGRAGSRTADPRVPHRGRPAPEAAAELLHRHDPRAQGAASERAHQGAHRGGDRAPGADREDLGARGAARHEGGRSHQPAGRWRRGLQHRGAGHDRGAEAHRRGVAQGASRGARARHSDQLHHAVRSRRDRRGPDRAPRRCCAICRTRPADS